MLKKFLAALGTLALVLGLVALIAGPASAHNHTVSASCAAGVSVNLTNYATSDASKHNTVGVWIDGVQVTNNPSFGGSFSQTYPFSAGQASHSYRVLVTAYDNNAAYGFDTGVVTVKGCETAVTPAPATATNPYCTAAVTVGGGGYTIPTQQSGVQYQLWNPVASTWANIAAGTYSAGPGAVVKIQAIATSGYKFTQGATTSWTFTLTTPDASKCVVPVAPTADASECTATPGSSTTATYTIPIAPAGYNFFLQGSNTPLTGGTVDVTAFPTTIVIVAKANPGYTFPAGTTTTWTFTFSSPGDCHVNVAPAAVVSNPAACTGPGVSSNNGFTITATPGVIYHLSTDATPLSAGFHSLGSGAGSVEIQATADAHYVLTGTVDWKFTFVAAADCLVPVPAGDPVFVDSACDAAHPGTAFLGTYTVLAADHVTYFASVNGSAPAALVVGFNNTAQPADVVVITPVVDFGYVITPAIASEKLSHTFKAAATDCLVKADFVQPKATSQSCVVTSLDGLDAKATHTLTDAFITIPSIVDSPHVTYFINGVEAASGDHVLAPGTYSVSAMAKTGYFLQGYNGPWSETLTSAAPCGDLITHPLVFPLATQVRLGCFTNGSYSLSNSINDAAALTWTVNGSVVSPGTYKVGTPSTVVVHAAANGPAYGLETGATTDWTFHFVRPTSCDLTTLALTGSTPTGWIIFGYMLLVSGLALVAVRFVRRRDGQM
ncbi:MAG: hypothetical protein ABIO06_11355 [Pseudolysinimonas sp.]